MLDSFLLESAAVHDLAPFLAYDDLRRCSSSSPAARDAMSQDSLWKDLLCIHFKAALKHLEQFLQPLETCDSPDREADQEHTRMFGLLLPLPAGAARQVYVHLTKTSSQPFVLRPRARLVLEIHELKDWNLYQKRLLLHRQAEGFAAALSDQQAVFRIRDAMLPDTLELVALQALVSGTRKTGNIKIDVPWMAWSDDKEQTVTRILGRRTDQRRTWLRKQRDYLLQDLSWQG